ncbi:MAG: hypothetical protein ACLRQU_18960 [Clostridium sp.]
MPHTVVKPEQGRYQKNFKNTCKHPSAGNPAPYDQKRYDTEEIQDVRQQPVQDMKRSMFRKCRNFKEIEIQPYDVKKQQGKGNYDNV